MTTTTIPGYGGARAGAGRKPSGHVPTDDAADYARARARNERAKAGRNELLLEVERGNLIPREAVRQASATALAVIMQSLRAMPDNLERSMSLAPEVAEALSTEVDRTLAELALALRVMAGEKA